jgi:hypothetical protein
LVSLGVGQASPGAVAVQMGSAKTMPDWLAGAGLFFVGYFIAFCVHYLFRPTNDFDTGDLWTWKAFADREYNALADRNKVLEDRLQRIRAICAEDSDEHACSTTECDQDHANDDARTLVP